MKITLLICRSAEVTSLVCRRGGHVISMQECRGHVIMSMQAYRRHVISMQECRGHAINMPAWRGRIINMQACQGHVINMQAWRPCRSYACVKRSRQLRYFGLVHVRCIVCITITARLISPSSLITLMISVAAKHHGKRMILH